MTTNKTGAHTADALFDAEEFAFDLRCAAIMVERNCDYSTAEWHAKTEIREEREWAAATGGTP